MEKTVRLSRTNVLVKIALMAVLAYILMMLDFPLPIFPGFLKIDLSDVPALIGGFALGPVAGAIIQLVKVTLFFFTRSHTGGVGELANFVIGASYVVPAALIYHRKKDRRHAVIGVLVGTIAMCVIGAFANMYVLIPFYSAFMPMEKIIAMGSMVTNRIEDVKTLVLYGVTPFNLFKGLLIAFITLIIYKRVSPFLKNQ